jgi:hypothetical protein
VGKNEVVSKIPYLDIVIDYFPPYPAGVRREIEDEALVGYRPGTAKLQIQYQAVSGGVFCHIVVCEL